MSTDLWNRCLNLLETRIGGQDFITWIRPLQANAEGDGLVLFAPNKFVFDWVRDHYLENIREVAIEVASLAADQVSLRIGGNESGRSLNFGTAPQSTNANDQMKPESTAAVGQTEGMNADFVFDTFVEGKSNQIARAAAVQVGENPGSSYNPLYIYGGVGLGKTHIMQAAGHLMAQGDPQFKVGYVHAERFVNDMVRALQHNKMGEFKSKYRSVNALLIDDVQFFAGKDRSQEEFFHTFNALFETGQQIIMTSDKFPRAVDGVEERLRSRFGWGLTVSVDPPELETRVAILHRKAESLGFPLQPDVAFFLGQRIKSNVRELEGALKRVIANARFTGQSVDIDFARDALRDMLSIQDRQLSPEHIQKTVAEYYNLRVADLNSKRRTRSITRPRQIAMALIKELTSQSLPEIGDLFGGRDHTTVLHACRKVQELRRDEWSIEQDYLNLLRALER